MRPDRLVVGEVRGAEVADLLAALNTGHDGGCGTLHANRPAEVPARLEALGVAAGLDRAAVHSQAAAALAVVVHLRRDAGRVAGSTRSGVVRRSGEFVTSWSRAGGPTAAPAPAAGPAAGPARPGPRPAVTGALLAAALAVLLWPGRRAAGAGAAGDGSRPCPARAGWVARRPGARRPPASPSAAVGGGAEHAARRRCWRASLAFVGGARMGAPRRRGAGPRSRLLVADRGAGRAGRGPAQRTVARGRDRGRGGAPAATATAAARWPAPSAVARTGRPPDGPTRSARPLERISGGRAAQRAHRVLARRGGRRGRGRPAGPPPAPAGARGGDGRRPGPARCCWPGCRCSGWRWAAASAPIRGGCSPRPGTGQVLLVAGVALELAGLAWSARLVRRAVR